MPAGTGALRLGLGADTVGAYGELTYRHKIVEDLLAFADARGGVLWEPVGGQRVFGSVVGGVEWRF